jgi:hypothetical protein
MEYHAFLWGLGISAVFLLVLVILQETLHSIRSLTFLMKMAQWFDIKEIDITVKGEYYTMEEQEVLVQVRAGPITLRAKPIRYKNLRFSVYEDKAFLDGYMRAVEILDNIFSADLTSRKPFTVTINGKHHSYAHEQARRYIKALNEKLEKKEQKQDTEQKTA